MVTQLASPTSLTRALSNRAFALVWSGQLLSRLGDFLYEIALAWWVLQITGSAAMMAGVLICTFAPMLVFLLIGGVASDRLPRLTLMLTADLGRGLLVALVALLAFLGQLEIWHILATSLCFGFVAAFFQPAYAAAVPQIVAEADLTSANALTSLSTQAGRVVGPALGAALVGFGGIPCAFALNALTFFVSAVLLALVRRVAPAPPAAAAVTHASVLTDLREGIGTVLDLPWLGITIAMFAFVNVALSGPYSVALPFLVREHFQANVHILGLLYALFASGYVGAGLWLGRQATLRRRGWLIYGGTLLAGLMLALSGLRLPLAVLGLAALINGAALELGTKSWTHALQTCIPREQLGRVSSIDALGSFALLPIGYGLAGWATDRLGAAPVCLIGGGATALLLVLVLALQPAVRQLD